MLKKHALLIAIAFTLLLTLVSFVNLNKIPRTGLSFEDKLFHFLAYAAFTLVWFNTFFNHLFKGKKNTSIAIAFVLAVIYGIIIEVLQGQLKMGRVTEFNDAIANSLGALFSAVFLKLNFKHVKK